MQAFREKSQKARSSALPISAQPTSHAPCPRVPFPRGAFQVPRKSRVACRGCDPERWPRLAGAGFSGTLPGFPAPGNAQQLRPTNFAAKGAPRFRRGYTRSLVPHEGTLPGHGGTQQPKQETTSFPNLRLTGDSVWSTSGIRQVSWFYLSNEEWEKTCNCCAFPGDRYLYACHCHVTVPRSPKPHVPVDWRRSEKEAFACPR
jgi:hypothetical protein